MKPLPDLSEKHDVQRLFEKDVLTTGEVARICHVAPRTVSKWVDTGQLRGYRIPGSRDRRIPVDHLLAFMRAHGIPSDGLAGGLCRVLIVGAGLPGGLVEALTQSHRYEVRTAATQFAAGLEAQQFRPQVVILDADGAEEAAVLCRQIRSVPQLQSVKVIAVMGAADPRSRRSVPVGLFDQCLTKPWSVWQVVRAIEEATNLVT